MTEGNNNQRDEAFDRLSEKNMRAYVAIERFGGAGWSIYARAALEEALDVFFSSDNASDRTKSIRYYMNWYRYGRKQGLALTQWLGTNLNFNAHSSPPQHHKFIQELVQSFLSGEIHDASLLKGVGYAIYYLISMLMMGQVFGDYDIEDRLFTLQKKVAKHIQESEFIKNMQEITPIYLEWHQKLCYAQ